MFIAEISSNHNRDLDRCIEMIFAAKEVGFDAVKFQLFRIEALFAPEALNGNLEKQNRRQWELPEEFIPILSRETKRLGMKFSCTPFYLDAIPILKDHVDFFKIASYELLWQDLITACAETTIPLVISTGMATLQEVLDANNYLLSHSPMLDVSFLHAVSVYPAPYKDVNLLAIETIRNATKRAVGWSDHTKEAGVIYRAVHKFGANLIELHFDLDGKGYEANIGHCWLPNEAQQVISTVKRGIEADGEGEKKPSFLELDERNWRADPTDGLRPIRQIRNNLNSDGASDNLDKEA